MTYLLQEIPTFIFSNIEPKRASTRETLYLHCLQDVQLSSKGDLPKSNHNKKMERANPYIDLSSISSTIKYY
jgi:hypothetical protein